MSSCSALIFATYYLLHYMKEVDKCKELLLFNLRACYYSALGLHIKKRPNQKNNVFMVWPILIFCLII